MNKDKHLLNKFFDKIYCINLVNEVERKKKCQKRFDKLGIEVEFFPAIKYGFNLTLLNSFKKRKNKGHDFTFPSEIGCALSHYSCIKRAKILEYKNVLIFEDDVVFDKKFNNIIKEYMECLPEDWDVMYFYSGIYNWRPEHYWVEGAEGKWYTAYDSNGCIAYALNAKIYDYVLDKFDQTFQISDNFFNKMQKLKIYHFYSAFPNLCAQEVNHSTINPDPNAIINVFGPMVAFAGQGKDDYE